EYQFRVGGDLDFARPVALVAQADAAHLLRRIRIDRYLGSGRQCVAPECEARDVFLELRLDFGGIDAEWLRSRRPGFTAVHVAKIEPAAPAVAGDVLAPTRDRQPFPSAPARARRGDHRRVVTVSKQGNARCGGSSSWHQRSFAAGKPGHYAA